MLNFTKFKLKFLFIDLFSIYLDKTTIFVSVFIINLRPKCCLYYPISRAWVCRVIQPTQWDFRMSFRTSRAPLNWITDASSWCYQWKWWSRIPGWAILRKRPSQFRADAWRRPLLSPVPNRNPKATRNRPHQKTQTRRFLNTMVNTFNLYLKKMFKSKYAAS